MNEAKQMQDETETDETEQSSTLLAATDMGASRGTASRALGLKRWVQYIFIVITAFLFWFLDKSANLIWQNFAEPNTTVVSAGAAVVAITVGLRLYNAEAPNRVATEIVHELAKVTWPSAAETRVSTIVVIITSLIAAAIVGAFDFVWSTITDLLYKYKV